MINPIQFDPATVERLAALDIGERAEVRVVMEPQPDADQSHTPEEWSISYRHKYQTIDEVIEKHSPFGPPGTRLYVEEVFSPCACDECVDVWPEQPLPGRIKLPPHMPSYESTHKGPSGYEFYPAEGLPCWAAQTHLTTIEGRVGQVDGVWQWLATVERCEGGDDADV